MDVLAIIAEEESAMASCMEEHGFVYVPEVPDRVAMTGQPSYPLAFIDPSTGDTMSEQSFAATYGLGLATDHQEGRTAGTDGRAFISARWTHAALENDRHQNSLPQSDRSSYSQALLSFLQRRSSELAESADRAAHKERSRREKKAVKEALRHPEVAAALKAWRAAMRKEGFRYESPDHGAEALEREFYRLIDRSIGRGGLPAGEALAEFRQRETEFAVANLRCGGDGVVKLFERVRRELLVGVSDLSNEEGRSGL